MDKKDISKILDKDKNALKAQLMLNAVQTTSNTLSAQAVTKYRESIASVTAKYVNQYKRGGSYCPDPNHLGKAKFVNWIDERYDTAKDDIIKYLKEYEGSQSPAQLAKGLSDIMKNDIDAKMIMRTETEKIRTAAKIDNMKQRGAKYVRYVAVMDDRVRPEHAALDGQIFPIDEAPVLGEPNCRCTYVEATEKQHDEFSKGYEKEEWTAETAQKWLETDSGKVTGLKNAAEAATEVEEKRRIFEEAMKTLDDKGKRMVVIDVLQKFKPDWCRVPLDKLVNISAEAFMSYKAAQEATTEVFDAALWAPNEEAKALYTKEELELFTKRLTTAKNTIIKDFPELATGIKDVKITLQNDTAFDWGLKKVYYNPHNEKLIAEAIKKGTLAKESSDYVLVHEMGHTLQHMAMGYKDYRKIAQVQKDSVKFWKELAEKKKLNIFYGEEIKTYDDLERVLGGLLREGYIGTTGRSRQFSVSVGDELIAESVVDYYINGAKCEHLSKQIVEFLREKINLPS